MSCVDFSKWERGIQNLVKSITIRSFSVLLEENTKNNHVLKNIKFTMNHPKSKKNKGLSAHTQASWTMMKRKQKKKKCNRKQPRCFHAEPPGPVRMGSIWQIVRFNCLLVFWTCRIMLRDKLKIKNVSFQHIFLILVFIFSPFCGRKIKTQC